MKKNLIGRLCDRYANLILPHLGISEVPFLYFTQCYPLYVGVRTRTVSAAILFTCADRTDLLPEASSTQCTHVVCNQLP